MTGPSASGSEKGTPISRTSAPAPSSTLRMSADRARSGSPAVVYVTKPGRLSFLNRVNLSVIRVIILYFVAGPPATCAFAAFSMLVGPHPHSRSRLGFGCAGSPLSQHSLHRLHILVPAACKVPQNSACATHLL